jgi:hypothetical protein
MRRIFLVLSAGLVMVALVVATAVPAFADRGIKGHATQTGECESGLQCDETFTFAGREGSNVPGGGGRQSITFDSDVFDPIDPRFEISGTTQGGGPEIGGGNCYFTSDLLAREFDEGGKGKRCPDPEEV